MATSSRMNTPLGRAQQNLQSSGNYAQNIGGPVRDYQILQNTPFGAMGLANRSATPVGRSMMDPERIADMMSRGRARFGQIAGARFLQSFQQNAIGNQLRERQVQMQEQHYADQKAARDKEIADKKAFNDATLNNMKRRPQFGQPAAGVSGVQAPATPAQPSGGLSNLPLNGPPLPLPQPQPAGSPLLTQTPDPLNPQPAPPPTPDAGGVPPTGPSGVAPPQAPATVMGQVPPVTLSNALSPEQSLEAARAAYLEGDQGAALQKHFEAFPSASTRLTNEEAKIWQQVAEQVDAYGRAIADRGAAHQRRDQWIDRDTAGNPIIQGISAERYTSKFPQSMKSVDQQMPTLDLSLIEHANNLNKIAQTRRAMNLR